MNPTGDQGDSVVGTNLGATTTLHEFLKTTGRLTLEERQLIVDQALVLIEQLYVHLPLKRAMHAVEPIQRLKLLRYRLDTMPEDLLPDERRFHDEMISIFTELRDMHTSYILPSSFQGKRAVVPFRIQRYFENGEPRYIVTEVQSALGDPHFKPGVAVTYWNGVPIDRAVELNAARTAGSNTHARHARGLATMTLRPMALTAPPDEEWVTVGYTSEGQQREIRLDWRVVETPPAPNAAAPDSAQDPLALTLGIDAVVQAVQRTRKMLFAPEAMEVERKVATLQSGGGGADLDMAEVSTMPDVLQFRPVSTAHGEYGYLRIWTFDVPPDAFVAEVVRILGLLPQNGIIVDVRGNPGGRIPAGERLLQVFTPKRIEPERLHFINTPLTIRLCEQTPFFEAWRESMKQAVETATTFSDGFPVLPGEVENCNRIGQQYHGPAILITDALCYSTTDFFAAGWQDHEIGPILGTDGNTGAGGANVINYQDLISLLSGTDSPIRPVPKSASFRVAIRRSTRVGERSGDPLEDLGVIPDRIHATTRNDVLNDNEDLITHAASILADLPVRVLSVEVDQAPDAAVSVLTTTQNISRLDAYIDGRPRLTLDVEDGQTTFDLPLDSPGSHTLELRGFEANQLVASRRIEM